MSGLLSRVRLWLASKKRQYTPVRIAPTEAADSSDDETPTIAPPPPEPPAQRGQQWRLSRGLAAVATFCQYGARLVAAGAIAPFVVLAGLGRDALRLILLAAIASATFIGRHVLSCFAAVITIVSASLWAVISAVLALSAETINLARILVLVPVLAFAEYLVFASRASAALVLTLGLEIANGLRFLWGGLVLTGLLLWEMAKTASAFASEPVALVAVIPFTVVNICVKALIATATHVFDYVLLPAYAAGRVLFRQLCAVTLASMTLVVTLPIYAVVTAVATAFEFVPTLVNLVLIGAGWTLNLSYDIGVALVVSLWTSLYASVWQGFDDFRGDWLRSYQALAVNSRSTETGFWQTIRQKAIDVDWWVSRNIYSRGDAFTWIYDNFNPQPLKRFAQAFQWMAKIPFTTPQGLSGIFKQWRDGSSSQYSAIKAEVASYSDGYDLQFIKGALTDDCPWLYRQFKSGSDTTSSWTVIGANIMAWCTPRSQWATTISRDLQRTGVISDGGGVVRPLTLLWLLFKPNDSFAKVTAMQQYVIGMAPEAPWPCLGQWHDRTGGLPPLYAAPATFLIAYGDKWPWGHAKKAYSRVRDCFDFLDTWGDVMSSHWLIDRPSWFANSWLDWQRADGAPPSLLSQKLQWLVGASNRQAFNDNVTGSHATTLRHIDEVVSRGVPLVIGTMLWPLQLFVTLAAVIGGFARGGMLGATYATGRASTVNQFLPLYPVRFAAAYNDSALKKPDDVPWWLNCTLVTLAYRDIAEIRQGIADYKQVTVDEIVNPLIGGSSARVLDGLGGAGEPPPTQPPSAANRQAGESAATPPPASVTTRPCP